MANRIDDLLDELATALDEVLPGRVTAYPRTEDVGAAVWVEMPTLTPNRTPSPSQVHADFPVWVVYDGTDRAQVAGLNDVVARVWDACSRLKHTWPLSSRPTENVLGDGRRSVVVTVRRLLAAQGFCLPDPPGESPIPPEPIDELPEEA